MGAVWNLPGVLDDQERSITSITKEDMRKLQVLQNTVLRLETGLGWYTPTETLVKRANQLSIHQLVAYHSALQVYKCRKTSEPKYMFDRFFLTNDNREGLRSVDNGYISINYDLSLSRGSFYYRASKIFNALPGHIKQKETTLSFKKHLRRWIKENISIVP